MYKLSEGTLLGNPLYIPVETKNGITLEFLYSDSDYIVANLDDEKDYCEGELFITKTVEKWVNQETAVPATVDQLLEEGYIKKSDL